MSNKQKTTDAQFKATDEIYNIARQEADLEIANLKQEIQAGRDDGFAIGSIKTNKVHRDFANFLDALMLYRTHKDKSYKKYGLTWDKFCEAVGYDRRQADRIISEVTPIFEAFSDNLPVLYGVTFNDIRWLGNNKSDKLSGFSEDGKSLIIGDEQIPATPEDITSYITHQKEVYQTELKEKDATITAQKKVLADNEKFKIAKEREIAKLEGKAKAKGLLPEEEGFLTKVEGLRLGFDGYLLKLDPERMEELSKHNDPAPTPRMRAAYLSALDYMKKQILIAFEVATELHGNAIMCPEAAWKPGMGTEIIPAKETSGKTPRR
jgi:hypothetical protein